AQHGTQTNQNESGRHRAKHGDTDVDACGRSQRCNFRTQVTFKRGPIGVFADPAKPIVRSLNSAGRFVENQTTLVAAPKMSVEACSVPLALFAPEPFLDQHFVLNVVSVGHEALHQLEGSSADDLHCECTFLAASFTCSPVLLLAASSVSDQ